MNLHWQLDNRDRLYGRRWREARRAYLLQHPFCVKCQLEGKLRRAVIVDHATPHKGNAALFWNTSLWQPLCKRHHDSDKQIEEKTGRIVGVDIEGRPLDPRHPWSKGTRPGGV